MQGWPQDPPYDPQNEQYEQYDQYDQYAQYDTVPYDPQQYGQQQYEQPPQAWPTQPMPPPPPPPPPSAGAKLAPWLAGGVVLVLATVVAGVAFATGGSEGSPMGNPGVTPTLTETPPSPTDSPEPSDSPTESPEPTTRDPTTMDDSRTDTMPFELSHLFPTRTFLGTDNVTYTFSASGFFSACQDAGGTKVQAMMRKYTCGNMAVGVYLNSGRNVIAGIMVIPLANAGEATSVYNTIKGDRTVFNQLSYWCPRRPDPGYNLCDRPRNPGRYLSYGNFHRYVLIAVALYTTGRSVSDFTVLKATSVAIYRYVTGAMLEP